MAAAQRGAVAAGDAAAAANADPAGGPLPAARGGGAGGGRAAAPGAQPGGHRGRPAGGAGRAAGRGRYRVLPAANRPGGRPVYRGGTRPPGHGAGWRPHANAGHHRHQPLRHPAPGRPHRATAGSHLD
ncbi:MAG: hypothetical protein MUE40_12440 [Anaerolineae bacterium]|nr:hypothetical protein [Anaerolineae bacterium]